MSRALANFMVNMSVNNRALAPGLRRSQRMVQTTMQRITLSVKQMFAGLGVTAFGVALFQGARAAATFEDAMVRVRINANLLGKEGAADFQRLSDKARELGASTRFSATQAAESMNRLALAGFNVNEVMVATEPLLNLATAASLELAEASTVATRQMKIWQMTAEDIPRIADTMTAAQANMRTTVTELDEGMSIAGALAKKVGMDFEQLAATIGLMQERSDSASKAGVALSIAIQKLAAPSKETVKILEEAGINLKDFVREATGEVDTFAAMTALVEKGATGVAATTKLFGARGKEIIKIFDVVSDSGAKGIAAVEEMAQKLRDSKGFAEAAADAMKKTFIGRLLELKSALEELAITFLGPLLEGILAVMRPLTAFIRMLAGLDKAWGGVLSDVLKVIATLASLSVLLPAVAAAASALGGMLAFLATNPLGWLVSAIGAALFGMLRFQRMMEEGVDLAWVRRLNDAWGDLKDGAKHIWIAIQRAVEIAIDSTARSFGMSTSDMKKNWTEWLDEAKDVLSKWVRKASMAFRVLAKNLPLALDFITTAWEYALVTVGKKIQEAKATIHATFVAIGAGVQSVFETMVKRIKHEFGKLEIYLAAFFRAVGRTITENFSIEKILKRNLSGDTWVIDYGKKLREELVKAHKEAAEWDKKNPQENALTRSLRDAAMAFNDAMKQSKGILSLLGFRESELKSKMNRLGTELAAKMRTAFAKEDMLPKSLTGSIMNPFGNFKAMGLPKGFGRDAAGRPSFAGGGSIFSKPSLAAFGAGPSPAPGGEFSDKFGRITPTGRPADGAAAGDFAVAVEKFDLATGRISFDSFGKSIQDAILRGDAADKDEKRNPLLEAGNMKQDELLKETKEVKKAVKEGGAKPGTLTGGR